MRRVCSWCNKEMDAGAGSRSGPDQITTHGICEACATDVLADIDAVELALLGRHPESRLKRMHSRTKLPDWQWAG